MGGTSTHKGEEGEVTHKRGEGEVLHVLYKEEEEDRGRLLCVVYKSTRNIGRKCAVEIHKAQVT